MRRHTWVWAALAWVAVVVVVSTVTWAVIDSAGRNVLAQQGGDTTGSAPADRPSGRASSPRQSEPRTTLSPTATEGIPSGGPSVAVPSETSPSRTSPSGSAGTSPPAPTTPPPTATGVTRTWQGTAGTVTVRCVGDRINLQSASPGDGWSVEVGEQGPVEVEVELTSEGEDGEEDEREVHVAARCVGGVPRFEVEQD